MKTLVKKIALGAVILAFILVVITIGLHEVRRRNKEEAFTKISTGNSKQEVLALLGEPEETRACRGEEGCKDLFIYYSFMERWGFVFDEDGKVIDKYCNVSY